MDKVVGRTKSRAFRIIWTLEEIGMTYEQVHATLGSSEAKLYHPLGIVPVMMEGEIPLTGSVAIMIFLADKHRKLTSPAGAVSRAKQDAMMLWLLEEMDAVLRMATKQGFMPESVYREPAYREALKARFAWAADVLSKNLNGNFLMGDEFALPDVLAGHCLNWAIGEKFFRSERKLLYYLRS
ncbi:hypothetical protein A8B78_14935 [Jannaschia sp. EhC01]|nr:hypothetical protein A8B78_14935 [Jannaschia sp. EhC01]